MHSARSFTLVACLAASFTLAACNKGTSSESESASSKTAQTADTTSSLPAGHPDVSKMSSTPTTNPALPAGHPQVTGQMPQLPAGHPQMPPTTIPADRPILWQLPQGWKEQAGMPPRYAVLTPPADRPAELAVTIFPGNVGGTLANINRWRQQVGAQPIAEGDLEKNITRIDSNNIKIIVADIAGPKAEDPAMLAAIVPDTANDSTWFFKLVGAKESIAKNKADFLQLVKSIKFAPPPPQK